MNRRQFLQNVGMGITAAAFLPSFQGCNHSLKTPSNHASNRTGRRPNILWIMLDDCRADAFGCYGKPWAKTPNIDKLAQDGVRFEAAICQNPVCLPSRRSIHTGHYVHQVGPMAMSRGKPPIKKPDYINEKDIIEAANSRPSLIDVWTMAGTKPVNVGKIHTGGLDKSWDDRGSEPHLLGSYGKPQSYFISRFGEDSDILKAPRVFTQKNHFQIGGVLPVKPEDTETWRLGDKAVGVLNELTESKEAFFLRVSFYAPHVACYVPHEYFIDPETITLPLPTEEELKTQPKFVRELLREYAGGLDLTRKQIDLCRGTYYGMVSLVDVQVGRLVKILKEKGLLDNTIIAINADQGILLGEHGLWAKRAFYEEIVKVPLIINNSELLPKGKVIKEPVEMIDFLPTLMDLSDIEVPEDIEGKSLLPLIQEKTNTWRKACFSEIDHSESYYDELRIGSGRRVMVRTKEYKLIFFMDSRVEDKDGALYNLEKDPNEQHNLYNDPKYAPVIKHLEYLAHQWDKGIF